MVGTDPSGPPLSTSLRLPQALPSPGVQLQPAMASAAPFGSWIFTAGLPSDERPIIHPVIAHSCLDLGLSQVLGNIFLDTATFSLHEGFDGSAANSFKPSQLCPCDAFFPVGCSEQLRCLEQAGAGAERGAGLWVTTGHRQVLAGGSDRLWLPSAPGEWAVSQALVWPGELLLSQCSKTSWHGAPELGGCSAR